MKKDKFFIFTLVNLMLVFVVAIISSTFNINEKPSINLITILPSIIMSVIMIYDCNNSMLKLTLSDIILPIVCIWLISIIVNNLSFFLMDQPLHRAYISAYAIFSSTTISTICFTIKKYTKKLMLERVITFIAYFLLVISMAQSLIHCFIPIIEVATPTIYTIVNNIKTG